MASKYQILQPLLSLDPMRYIFQRPLSVDMLIIFCSLETTASQPMLLAPLLSLPQSQVFPKVPHSVFSSSSPLLPCQMDLHGFAYLHRYVAFMSILTILNC